MYDRREPDTCPMAYSVNGSVFRGVQTELTALSCRAGANVTRPCSSQGRTFAALQPIAGTRPSDLLLILKLVFIPLLVSQPPWARVPFVRPPTGHHHQAMLRGA